MDTTRFISLTEPPVRRYISHVNRKESGNDSPTSIIIEAEMSDGDSDSKFSKRFRRHTRTVAHPSKISRKHPSQEFFKDTAKTIVDDPDIGRSFPPRDSDDQPFFDDWDPEVQRWEQKLHEFSWKVMDYSGGFHLTREAFIAALSDHFLVPEIGTYRVIVPLLNVNSMPNRIPLTVAESNVKPHPNNPYVTQDLAIERFTNPELSAIFTYEGYLSDPTQQLHAGSGLSFNHPSQKLMIEFVSSNSTNFGLGFDTSDSDFVARSLIKKSRKTAERVVSAMRLDETSSKPGTGQAYIVTPDWRTYRDDINSIDLYRPWTTGYEPRMWQQERKGSSYSIDEQEFLRVQRFWDRYSYYISFDEEAPFERSLSRFNEIYKRSNSKDQIVDSVIIFEGLLTKGCEIGGLGTTLRLIGSLLLDDRSDLSRSDLRDFLSNLYYARSQIVHDDATWNEIIESESFNSIDTEVSNIHSFASFARKLASRAILTYMDQMIEHDRSIGATNMRIYDAMRNVSNEDVVETISSRGGICKSFSITKNSQDCLSWLESK